MKLYNSGTDGEASNKRFVYQNKWKKFRHKTFFTAHELLRDKQFRCAARERATHAHSLMKNDKISDLEDEKSIIVAESEKERASTRKHDKRK